MTGFEIGGIEAAMQEWVVVSRKNGVAALIAFWLMLLPMYGWWLWRDRMIAPWDMSIHSLLSYDAWGCIKRGDVIGLFSLSNYYPPLFHWIAAPLSLIGSEPKIYCLANWLILAATMLGTARLGGLIFGEASGLAAGMLAPAYIYMSWMARMPMTDLALTATVVWSLCLLTSGAPLTQRRQRHAVGVMIGLGMLAKWPYLFFLAGPLAIYFWRQWREIVGGVRHEFPLRLIAPLALWPVAIAGPWYLQAVSNLIRQTGRHFVELGPMKGDPAGLSWASVMYYPQFLYLEYFTLPLMLLLAGGVVGVARAWRLGRIPSLWGWKVVLAALGVGYLTLTLIGSKDSRYIMPLVPVLAVISAGWVSGVGRKRMQITCVAAMAALSLGTVAWNLFVFHPPDLRDRKLEAAAEWLIGNRGSREAFRVGVIPNEWDFNASAMNYALHRRDEEARAWRVKQELDEEYLKYFLYVVAVEPPPAANALDQLVETNTRRMAANANWEVAVRIPQQDWGEVVIYRRRSLAKEGS